jgi:two-component system CheB/CheR fusion protein
VLSKASGIPLIEAENGTVVEINNGYIVPANATLAITDGTLRLHKFDTAEDRRTPIDAMFSSLAASRGDNSIGVVLSGTGSDGAHGIKEIKAAGGITFAQDPDTARFDGMPRNAIATGCVDFILDPPAIAEKLPTIERYPMVLREPPGAGRG